MKRSWLFLLFVAEMFTGTVLRHYDEQLSKVVALSFFIPLLIGTGGNAGFCELFGTLAGVQPGIIAEPIAARQIALDPLIGRRFDHVDDLEDRRVDLITHQLRLAGCAQNLCSITVRKVALTY